MTPPPSPSPAREGGLDGVGHRVDRAQERAHGRALRRRHGEFCRVPARPLRAVVLRDVEDAGVRVGGQPQEGHRGAGEVRDQRRVAPARAGRAVSGRMGGWAGGRRVGGGHSRASGRDTALLCAL